MRDDRGVRLQMMQQAKGELVDQLSRLQKQVDALEEGAKQVAMLDEQIAATLFRQQINPDLGNLTMRGNGEVVQVDLDETMLRHIEPSEIGQRVLDAICQARVQISEKRSTRLSGIFRHLL